MIMLIRLMIHKIISEEELDGPLFWVCKRKRVFKKGDDIYYHIQIRNSFNEKHLKILRYSFESITKRLYIP